MNILIPLAEGFEEIEAMASIDVLRRAGFSVVTAGLPGTIIRGSKGVKIIADKKLEDIKPEEFDTLVLVGGYPGYQNLGQSKKVRQMIRDFNSKKKLIGAICAAPTLLAKEGILNDRRATVYPGMEREISRPRGDRVVVDTNVVTSQGPGTAVEFALKLVEVLAGRSKSEKLRGEIVC